jgi:hypothetical protein
MARSGKTAREALDDLVTFELLAVRAARMGTTPPPPSRELLVQRLLERDFEPQTQKDSLSDAVIQPLYERARVAYIHSRLVEIAVLSVYTGPAMKPEPRAVARQNALAIAAHVEKIGARTEKEFRAIGSDLDWTKRDVRFTRQFQSDDKPFSAKVGAAVQKMRSEGERTGLIEDETGFHIATYLGEKPARNTSFDEAKGELRDAYFSRWRKEKFLAFMQALRAETKIELYPKNLLAAAKR